MTQNTVYSAFIIAVSEPVCLGCGALLVLLCFSKGSVFYFDLLFMFLAALERSSP